MSDIILASSSPRRKEILRRFGLDPIIDPPNIKEEIRDFESPRQIVMALAFEKAMDVSKNYENKEIIIASDTLVTYNGDIIAKPADRQEAFKKLKSLSGKTHSVITGLAIIRAGSNEKIIDCVETYVSFKELEDSKIERYLDTGEYKDKAGGYGIQGYGQLLVEEIEGSYLNVVGLPIEKLDDILEKNFKINLI